MLVFWKGTLLVLMLTPMRLFFVVQGEAARLVVPRVCQKVLFDEAHCGHVAAHFGARRMYALLAARVW